MRDLIGKQVLWQPQNSHESTIYHNEVEYVSPSGKYVSFGGKDPKYSAGGWFLTGQVRILENLNAA